MNPLTVRDFTYPLNYLIRFDIVDKYTQEVLAENISANTVPKNMKEKNIYLVFPKRDGSGLQIHIYDN